MRKLLLIMVSLLSLFLIVRAFSAAPGGGGAPVSQIVILQGGLPDHLDPARNLSLEHALPLTGIYEGLVRLNPQTLLPEPCLAESWGVSDDGRRWTFHLKQGIQFSDGTPCDAEAVKASMARSMVLRDREPYCALAFGPVSTIEADGKYAVSFLLKYPYSPFLKNLALPFAAPVVSPGALGRHGDDFWRHPSGTGPYMLKEISRTELVLQANPRYRGRPAAGNIVIRALPDCSQRNEHLLEGKADIIFQPGVKNLDRLRDRGMKIVSVPGIDVSYLGFYTDKPPFNNRHVRMAAAYALDREKLVAAALGGEGVPASGLAPPPLIPGKAAGLPKYSPDQARRILIREGYPSGLDVTLITYQDARRYCPPGGTALAEEIKRQLEPAGIRVAIQSRSWNEHKEALGARTGHFFLYGWTGDNGDADNFMYTLLASSQVEYGLNASGYTNSRLDVYLHTARRVSDTRSRDYLYLQAEGIILDEAPVTAINHSIIRLAHRPGIEKVSLSGLGLMDLYTVKKI